MLSNERPCYFNLNIGTGTSVLELVKTFEKVNKVKIPYKYKRRRMGDAPYVVADNTLSISRIQLSTKEVLRICVEMVGNETLNPYGYQKLQIKTLISFLLILFFKR